MGSWICLGGLKNDTTAPTTPVISATVASSTEIDIALTTPSTDAGGLRQYVLERSPNGSTSWTTLATGLSIFPYADTGLTSSTTYYYRCTASDFAANASVSTTVNGTTSSSGAFTPPGSLFYSSDFNSATNGADVTGTVMNWGANDGPIKYSTDFSRTNQGTGKSIKLPFGPVPPGQTYQLNFDLSTQYREVTFQYYLRYPSGYRHVDSPSSDNDKFFRIHQRTGGSNPVDAPGYDTGEKLGCSTELAARGNTQYCDLASEWDIGTDGQGFTARSGLGGTLAVAYSDFITPADVDQWTKIVWYVKAPTAKGSGRAILKVWKNDVLIIDEQPDVYSVGEDHSYGKGYLFGTRNTGDDPSGPTYTVYLDDISVWVNP